MPIGYQPMQAFDEKALEAYGAAQTRQQNAELMVRSQGQNAEAQARQAALNQQNEHFYAQMGNQNAMAGYQTQVHEGMQNTQIAAQQNLQNQRIQAEFTQADNLRLQRINQDAAGWEQLHLNGGIDDRTFAAGQEQIRRGQQPLMARREAARVAQEELENKRLTQQAATAQSIIDGNARHDAESVAGSVRHFEDPDTGDSIPHQWDRLKAQWVPMRSGGGSGGSGGSGGTVRQMTTPQLLESYTRSQPHPAAGEAPRPAPTAQQLDDHAKMLEKLEVDRQERQREQRRRQPGTTALFDPLPIIGRDAQGQPVRRQPANNTEFVQQSLSQAALAAHREHRGDDEEVVRAIGGRLRDKNPLGGNITTGQLTPAEQTSLSRLVPGYYHDDFTPALDRELGRIETGGGRSFISMPGAAPGAIDTTAESQAARGIRTLLGQYGSLENINRRGTVDERNAIRSHLATIRTFQWGGAASEGGSRMPQRPPNQADVAPGPTPRPANVQNFNPNLSFR